MKRILLLLAILFLLTVSASATEITIQSSQISGWQSSVTAPRLRIFLSKTIVTSDNQIRQGGGVTSGIFYKEVVCSVAGGVLTIPEFTIDSTTDAINDNTAKYSAYFYTGSTQIQVYRGFESFSVPALPTTTDWGRILTYNQANVAVRDSLTYNRATIDAMLALLGGGAPPNATYITKTDDPILSAEFALASLGNGPLKHTGSGNIEIATAGTDYELPVTVSPPLARAGQNVSIPLATSLVDGYLSAADRALFAGKENVITFNSPLSRAANSVSLNPIADANVASGAGIALNKLAALPSGRAVITDGSGIFSVSSVTSATLAFLDATSSVQTQLNGKQPLDADLTALAALGSTGVVARTAANTYALRSLVAASTRLSISFADFTTGNPTFDVVEANLDINAIGGGPLEVTGGGTNLSALGTANQILGVNAGASAYEFKTIAGTADEVSVTHGAGTITLAIPATVDFSNKTATMPIRAGMTAPSTCVAQRELFIDTDASPGQQLFICNATGDGFVLVGDAGGAGSGITSLNSLTASSQTFSRVNDTNITLTITSTTDNHEFALGFTGQLAKSRQHANTVYSDQANTYSAGSTQTVQPSANFVGLNIAPGSDPSSLSHGDVWINGDSFRWRGAAASFNATPDGRTLTAGNGLTGGGDLSNDRTFDVVGGVGITANANDVAWSPNTFTDNMTFWAGDQATRTLTANVTGTDPVVSFSSGIINITAGLLQAGGSNVATGTNSLQLDNKTLGTGNSVANAISWADNVRQTFNPGPNSAGLNVGPHTADPSSPTNGDVYYNSNTNKYRFRENGAWVELGGGGTPGGGNLSLQYNSGGVFAGSTGHTINSNVLTLGAQSPASPSDGALWRDMTREALSFRQVGLSNFLSGSFFTATANATVANTVSETSIVGSGIGTTTLPAGFLTPGRRLRVTVRGVLSTDGVTQRTLTIRVSLGGTIISQVAIGPDVGSSNLAWAAHFDVICRTTGVSGTVVGGGNAWVVNATQTALNASGSPNNAGTVTINTTTSQALGVTAQWSNASSLNSATSTIVTYEVLN